MVDEHNCYFTVRRRVLDEQQFTNNGHLIKNAAIEQNTDFDNIMDESRRFIKRIYDNDKVDPPEHLYLYCTGVAYGVLTLTRAWWYWHIRSNNSKCGMSTMHFDQKTNTWSELVFFDGC